MQELIFVSFPSASWFLWMTGMLNFILGLIVLTKTRKAVFVTIFFLVSIALGLWAIAMGVCGFNHFIFLKLYAVKLIFIVGAVIALLALLLSQTFLRKNILLTKKKLFFLSLPAAILTLFILVFGLVSASVNSAGFIVLSFSSLIYIYHGYVVVYFLWACWNFFKLFKISVGIEKMKFKYFLVGSFLAIIVGVICNVVLVTFNIPYLVYFGPLGTIFIVGFTSYAIVKYKLMDIRVVITRSGIFLGIYFLVLGISYFVGYITKSWFLSTTFATFLSILGIMVYHILQKKAEDSILNKQRHYQYILLQAAAGMVRESKLQRLLKVSVYIIKRVVGIRYVAMFFHEDKKQSYCLQSNRPVDALPSDAVFPDKFSFIFYLQTYPVPVTAAELPDNIREEISAVLKTSFALIVPIALYNKILGFLVLGEKNDHTMYSLDDINVFKILSRQAALAIQNCLFWEEFKQTETKIFAMEKLASIGGMAEGIIHQMKNHLNNFYVASLGIDCDVKEFIRKQGALAEQENFKKIFDEIVNTTSYLIENVKKSDQMINAIFDFSSLDKKESYFTDFSLNDLTAMVVDTLKIKHKIPEFPLELLLDRGKDTIFGVKPQIMEIIYNLLDNAYESIKEKKQLYLTSKESKAFRFKISLMLTHGQTSSRIAISDNGMGIKPEDQDKIFKPFFSTKTSLPIVTKTSTGIGVYVVKRMIEENHHGKIWFNSVYTQGATFYVELPCRQSSSSQTIG